MVMVRRQFQVHASDFHFLVRVLDTQIRQADFAIDHRKVQLLRVGMLEVECLFSPAPERAPAFDRALPSARNRG